MSRDPRYDVLFEPVRIGPLTARNRFYQVPHCNGSGYRYPRTQAAMRGMKAEGGWAVVCTEWCTVHPSSDTTPSASARLWTDEDVRTNALMTDAVHRHGALAGCELAHSGLYSHNGGYDDMLGSRFRKEGWQEPGVAFVKQVTTKPVVGVGRFTSPDTTVAMVRRGVLDFIGIEQVPASWDPPLPWTNFC